MGKDAAFADQGSQLQAAIAQVEKDRADYDQRVSAAVAKINELQAIISAKNADLNNYSQTLATRTSELNAADQALAAERASRDEKVKGH